MTWNNNMSVADAMNLTHLDGPPGLFDHELQSSKRCLCGAAGVHVGVTVVWIIERNHHGLVSGQLQENNKPEWIHWPWTCYHASGGLWLLQDGASQHHHHYCNRSLSAVSASTLFNLRFLDWSDLRLSEAFKTLQIYQNIKRTMWGHQTVRVLPPEELWECDVLCWTCWSATETPCSDWRCSGFLWPAAECLQEADSWETEDRWSSSPTERGNIMEYVLNCSALKLSVCLFYCWDEELNRVINRLNLWAVWALSCSVVTR